MIANHNKINTPLLLRSLKAEFFLPHLLKYLYKSLRVECLAFKRERDSLMIKNLKNMDDIILIKLNNIEIMLQQQNLLKKDVLNLNETCTYLDISHSQLILTNCTGATQKGK